jgi:CBS domain-containing protein
VWSRQQRVDIGWEKREPEMVIRARDIMKTRFRSLHPDMTVAEAIQTFRKGGDRDQARVFGMVVTDQRGHLAGMLSIYDMLLFVRPRNIRDWENMEDAEVHGLMEATCQRLQKTLVRDIMTTDVITVTPDTHVVKILDLMIRRHVRRLPVVAKQKIVGMVYISALLDYLGDAVMPVG